MPSKQYLCYKDLKTFCRFKSFTEQQVERTRAYCDSWVHFLVEKITFNQPRQQLTSFVRFFFIYDIQPKNALSNYFSGKFTKTKLLREGKDIFFQFFLRSHFFTKAML